ncbi:MAG: hypothetical protein CMP11_05210 [Zetaproteobacteria bacterium]|nr:hypothetical protein [Pseudobdellovibrionaceae bacterium]
MLVKKRYKSMILGFFLIGFSFFICENTVIAQLVSSKEDHNKKEQKKPVPQEANYYINMFSKVYNKVKEKYVDEIDDVEMLKSGIRGMLRPLDPYTKFLIGESKAKLEMLTKGKYGGVGIRIGLRKDVLTVLSLMESGPAGKAGILPGDQIVRVDEFSTSGLEISEISKKIRGELGSTVYLEVIRPWNDDENIIFELKRSNIIIQDVPYSGVDEQKIGYIKVRKFSKHAAKDFKSAVQSLSQESIEGLIIDLRGNSGGLLRNAIDILDFLVPKGQTLLKVKGRKSRQDKIYRSKKDPILKTSVPLVVLVNRKSASASEIVSGVLQDVDRAVVMGKLSYGKGLVQKIYDLDEFSTVKVTAAKYYLPSGRLIQRQDYFEDSSALVSQISEKDKVYKTQKGRNVKGGGGITPDIVVESARIPSFVSAIWAEDAFLSFAVMYAHKNKLQAPITVTDKMVKEFQTYLKTYDLEFSFVGEKSFEKMKEDLLEFENLESINIKSKSGSSVQEMLSKMEKFFEKQKLNPFEHPKHIFWIKNGLRKELSLIVGGEKERIYAGLIDDVQYQEAKKFILEDQSYVKILEVPKKKDDPSSFQ